MNCVFHKDFKVYKAQLDAIIENFSQSGDQLGKGERNVIKLFDLDEKKINVKSFKIPNLVNKIMYRFFRKGKAQRSFEFANKISEMGIGTPQPIAYYEFPQALFFKRSYYISEHLDYDLTFRKLTHDLNYPDHEVILRAFTRFTYKLHELNINFLDHSPGNTLIKKSNDTYEFFLVDLNRMEFEPMPLEKRIRNFERLTIHKSMIETMSDEYAKCSGENFDTIFNLMWTSTQKFQDIFHRKKRIKKRLKFWK